MTTFVLTLRPVFFSRRCARSASWASESSRNAACTSASSTLVLVLERLELVADLGEQGEPAVLGEHAHEVLASPVSRPERMAMKRPATWASVRFGSAPQRALARRRRRATSAASISDHLASAPASTARLNAAPAQGRATVLGSAIKAAASATRAARRAPWRRLRAAGSSRRPHRERSHMVAQKLARAP